MAFNIFISAGFRQVYDQFRRVILPEYYAFHAEYLLQSDPVLF
jgi:hypothetical protein